MSFSFLFYNYCIFRLQEGGDDGSDEDNSDDDDVDTMVFIAFVQSLLTLQNIHFVKTLLKCKRKLV